MTNKEKAIREFMKAMRTADAHYIARGGGFTLNLDAAWDAYVVACQREVQNGQAV